MHGRCEKRKRERRSAHIWPGKHTDRHNNEKKEQKQKKKKRRCPLPFLFVVLSSSFFLPTATFELVWARFSSIFWCACCCFCCCRGPPRHCHCLLSSDSRGSEGKGTKTRSNVPTKKVTPALITSLPDCLPTWLPLACLHGQKSNSAARSPPFLFPLRAKTPATF